VERRFQLHPGRFCRGRSLAGGHLGFKADELDLPENRIERLVPDVIEAINPFAEAAGRAIPVIARRYFYG